MNDLTLNDMTLIVEIELLNSNQRHKDHILEIKNLMIKFKFKG
jgi:hypothetical protein